MFFKKKKLVPISKNEITNDNDDHFYPLEDITFDNRSLSYKQQVKDILLNGLEEEYIIRVQCFPSRGTESIFLIKNDSKLKKHLIIYSEAQKNISQYFEEQIQSDIYQKYITKEDVELLTDLFSLALSQTKFPKQTPVVIDGIRYIFSIRIYGEKSAQATSPQLGSRINELTVLLYAIQRQLTYLKIPEFSLDEEIKQKIKRLMIRFETI